MATTYRYATVVGITRKKAKRLLNGTQKRLKKGTTPKQIELLAMMAK